MIPRNLRILQIDDDVPKRFDFSSDSSRRIPEFIDPIPIPEGNTEKIAIMSWRDALNYWSAFDPNNSLFPDLITSDVQFKDTTSPLDAEESGVLLPTGLSHFKPFAAMARALARPVGYAIHSADGAKWRNYLADRQATQEVKMLARLAGHEAAEVAAILGELPNTPSDRVDYEVGFRWLENTTITTKKFLDAFKDAIETFRREIFYRLENRTLIILPHDWESLAKWCHDNIQNPKPLSDNNDPGITLHSDGRSDCISIRSLFADVQIKSAGRFSYHTSYFPEQCFKLETALEPYSLIELTHPISNEPIYAPLIGGLIAPGEYTTEIYQEALKVLNSYSGKSDSGTEAPPNLNDFRWSTSRPEPDIVAKGMAVFFALVQRSWILNTGWRRYYSTEFWDVEKGVFTTSQNSDLRLSVYLRNLSNFILQEFGREDFTEAELISRAKEGNRFKYGDAKYVGTYLELLLQLSSLEKFEEQDGPAVYEYGRPPKNDEVPELPLNGRYRILSSITGSPQRAQSHTSYLNEKFGYPAHNRCKGVFGILGRAFFPSDIPGEKRDHGQALLESFLTGRNVPGWVRTLARNYAREELDWDQRHWPVMLTSGQRNL